LMDQSMPRKDGVTATREIRELEAAGKIRRRPIIAVTAVVNSESQHYFRKAGADAFFGEATEFGEAGGDVEFVSASLREGFRMINPNKEEGSSARCSPWNSDIWWPQTRQCMRERLQILVWGSPIFGVALSQTCHCLS